MRALPPHERFTTPVRPPYAWGDSGAAVALLPVSLPAQLAMVARQSTQLARTPLTAPRTAAFAAQPWLAAQEQRACGPLTATRMHVRVAFSPAYNRL